jgi:hypothetical protein
MAVGESALAAGDGSLAQGEIIWRSGAENIKTSDGKYYVNSNDCEIVNLAGIDKCEVISKEDLETLVLEEVVLLTDGSYMLLSDRRYVEAYGTGSASMGQGSVAYSRSSKSLGYRTQAGAPSTPELRAKRPEIVMSTFNVFEDYLPTTNVPTLDADKAGSYIFDSDYELHYTPPGAGGLLVIKAIEVYDNLSLSIDYQYIGN